jgi:AcrR family transcriptional regulator
MAERRPGRPRDESINVAILDATVDEMIDKGMDGMSMEGIAARAGVAKTTVYRRWSAIDELCIAAICRLDSAVEAVEPSGETVRDELLAHLERMRRKWTNDRYGAVMRRAAADAAANPELYASARARIVGPHIAAMNRTLQRAVDEGVIRSDVDLDWVRQLLVAPVLAATMTLKTRVSRAQLEFTLDTVLGGLAPGSD